MLVWCGKRGSNPYGKTTRPSNVRVCLFRHSRDNANNYTRFFHTCQGVYEKIFIKFKIDFINCLLYNLSDVNFPTCEINCVALRHHIENRRIFALSLKYSRSSLLASRQTRTSYIIIYVMLISQGVKLTVLPCGTTTKTFGFRTFLEI